MNPMIPQDSLLIQNDSGMAIPPRSVVIVTSVEIASLSGDENQAIHHVDQYSGQFGNILVTGPFTIPKAGFARSLGRAFVDDFIYVAIDPAATNPTPGDEWGPVSNKWTIGPKGRGFFAQGYAETSDSTKRSLFYRGNQSSRFWCVIRSTLSVGSPGSPSTCLADVWLPDPSSTSSAPPLIATTKSSLLSVQVVNYDPTLTAAPGFVGKIEWIPPNWSLYWLQCPSSGG